MSPRWRLPSVMTAVGAEPARLRQGAGAKPRGRVEWLS